LDREGRRSGRSREGRKGKGKGPILLQGREARKKKEGRRWEEKGKGGEGLTMVPLTTDSFRP